jgi:hypothetical protein
MDYKESKISVPLLMFSKKILVGGAVDRIEKLVGHASNQTKNYSTSQCFMKVFPTN